MKRIFSHLIVGGLLLLAPVPVFAARLYLLPTHIAVQTGHTLTAELRLDTQGESINALDVEIQFDTQFLRYASSADASSLINIWLERPHQSTPGVITLSGVSPGGFVGDGVIAQLTFSGLRTGATALKIATSSRVLLDRSDGKSSFVLSNDSSVAVVDTPVSTTEIATGTITVPEPIIASLDRTPIGHNDLWFVSFAAQDKGSGIKEISVRERLLGIFAGEWKSAQSPYVLENQNLMSTITIRAINYAGQTRETTIVPVRLKTLYAVGFFFGLVGLFYVVARPLVKRLPRIRA